MDIQGQVKGIEIEYIIKEGVPMELFTDQKRLKQIIFNLIGNALKFTKKGKISVIVEVEPQNERQENEAEVMQVNEFDGSSEHYELKFSVADTGYGIKAEDLNKLFKMFGKLKVSAGVN